MLHFSKALATATLLATIALSAPALAEKGGHKHYKDSKHDRHDDRHDHDDRRNNDRVVVIHDHDRVVIRDYIQKDYYRHCPPGLAKKHNGCMPPGHAKKRYVVGQPLVVVYEPVPRDVLVRLEPVPRGYRYVRVDNDVLLISEASHHVIDAITLLSAVGN